MHPHVDAHDVAQLSGGEALLHLAYGGGGGQGEVDDVDDAGVPGAGHQSPALGDVHPEGLLAVDGLAGGHGSGGVLLVPDGGARDIDDADVPGADRLLGGCGDVNIGI
jgi:hypothetical protein